MLKLKNLNYNILFILFFYRMQKPITDLIVKEEPKKEQVKIICKCGSTIVAPSLKYHLKSKNHLNYVNSENTNM